MKRRWSRTAAAQLKDIREYIARKNPAAARTVGRIVEVTERLEKFPNSGRRGSVDGTLELIVSGLPYLVVYEIGDNAVEIHGVFHSARDPAERGAGDD